MTKRISAKKKPSRSLSVNLWGRANDPFNKRNYRPGQHGTAMKRETTYGTQLRAKQKLRKYYVITEAQFKNIFTKARSHKGDTAESFVGLLESRIDSIIYRANFVPTMYAAKQTISHKHVKVNGKIVNISSYVAKPGDIIEITEKARNIPLIAEAVEKMEREVPTYLDVNTKDFTAKYVAVPRVEDVPYPCVMDVNLVVEYYSR